MIDTIGIFIENASLPKPQDLEDLKDNVDMKTGEMFHTGKLKNLFVRSTINGVSIKGSMCKYYLGNNLKSLTREDILPSIEKMSDEIGLDLKNAKLFRLDIAANFVMKESVQSYTSCLGSLSRYKKSEYSNKQTMLFYNTLKTVQFYDKIAEMRKSKGEIPEILKMCTNRILRYEVQFKKKLALEFGRKEIRFFELSGVDLFRQFIERWSEYYFSISKISGVAIKCDAFKDVKQMEQILAAYGLQEAGSDYVFGLLNGQKDIIGESKYYRMKNKLITLNTIGSSVDSKELMAELDSKILQVVNATV